jgi:hypothetical protein
MNIVIIAETETNSGGTYLYSYCKNFTFTLCSSDYNTREISFSAQKGNTLIYKRRVDKIDYCLFKSLISEFLYD